MKKMTDEEFRLRVRGANLCIAQFENIKHEIKYHFEKSEFTDKQDRIIEMAQCLTMSNVIDVFMGNIDRSVYTNPDKYKCNCKKKK